MDEPIKKTEPLILSDGREIVIDLKKVTISEWRAMFKPEQAEEDGDHVLGKVTGMTVDQIGNLNVEDYRRVSAALFKKFREPLADPF